MKWLGIIRRFRECQPPAPTLTAMLPLLPIDRPSDRDVRLVRDVATHVTSKVVPIVELHGRTMENALQANVMAVEVALRLGLEAAQRTALTAVAQGAPLELALEKLDDAIAILAGGLNDHRCELAATIEAVHAGIAGGQVRQ